MTWGGAIRSASLGSKPYGGSCTQKSNPESRMLAHNKPLGGCCQYVLLSILHLYPAVILIHAEWWVSPVLPPSRSQRHWTVAGM